MLCILLTFLCCFSAARGFLDDADAATLQIQLTAMKSQMSALQSTVNAMQSQLNATSDLAAKAAALPHHTPVVFTAHLSQTLTNLGLHQHVVFDNVVTNIGDAYSTSQGHFTAPVLGVYFFFITATNVPGHSVLLSLMLNGVPKAVTLAHVTSSTAAQYETSSCSVALMLKAGDEVWAQNEGQFSPVEELDGYNYSSFGGFLIHQL